jgi:trk system potassium uptake protein TrkA
MYVIVVGCGRVGADLAGRLSRGGHDVTVIDHVGSSFEHLDPAYRGRTIEAEPLSEGVLKNAGAERADALAAVTNSDAVNAVASRIARSIFQVPVVVSRNYDPRWRALHEALGVHTVSTTLWGARRIEQLLENPGLRAVFSAGNGEVEVYELVIGGHWAGQALSSLVDGIPCAPVSLTQGGKARVAEADARLGDGDLLHVAATRVNAERLRQRLVSQEASSCSS